MLYKVGITGNICSGKSACTKYLSSLSTYGLNYDEIGHTVYNRNLIFMNTIKRIFWPLNKKIIMNHNSIFEELNRKELGNVVFRDKNNLDILNCLIRPEMRNLLKTHFRQFELNLKGSTGIVFVEGALIIEGGSKNLFDEVWMTVANKEDMENRFVKRLKDNRTEEYDKSILDKVLQNQMPEEEKMKYCNEVIDTSNELEVTKLKYHELYLKLLDKLKLKHQTNEK